MAGEAVVTAPTRRERARAATVDEIKQTALALMRERATTDVRFADIARAMGLTAPALYRYFADRDELLTAMIVDGYDDLSDALADAAAAVGGDDLGALLMATAEAYRQWASQDQQRFALIFGLPVPGYAAPSEGPTHEAAKRAMGNLEALVLLAMSRGEAQAPLVSDIGPALAAECASNPPVGAARAIPHPTYQAMLHCWAMLHGFACLEAYGHLHAFSDEARDELFIAEVRLAARAMGLPAPDPA